MGADRNVPARNGCEALPHLGAGSVSKTAIDKRVPADQIRRLSETGRFSRYHGNFHGHS